MNHETIGKAAGSLWNILRESGEDGVTVASIKKTPGVRPDEAVAAIGWLAREGKLQFKSKGNRHSVCLVSSELQEVCTF